MNSGTSILLTGVTGFVGKVVLESLLRRKAELNIKTVYVLIREQTNRRTGEKTQANERFIKEVVSSACFRELPEKWEKDVKVISGDLTANSFGIEKSVLLDLQQDLNKVINCAASVEFDLPLADAAAANITSALNVLEFSSNCPKLDAFVNVSTAYVSPHPGEGVAVPEELVNLPFDPEVVYQSILAGTADEKALMAQTGHPNTYTFTKCLSEILLSRRKGNVPLTIVRPSIISSSWKYPHPGWIDSYAAFAGFVSLIGSGMIKCVSAQENTILDIVPCDEVAERVIDTAFWPKEDGTPPFIQHVVTGLDRGCRIDTCLAGIESYFQRNPVHRWAKIKKASNGKSIRFDHLRYHTIPSRLAGTWFSLSGKAKQSHQVKKMLNKIEYLNDAFPYFTHNSFAFESARPLNMPLEAKQYIELVCSGVHENLMKHKPDETSLAGAKHKHPQQDIRWVNHKPKGNWAIRTASYVVRKGLRKCTDLITFDRPSFENAITSVEPGSLITIIPNHRSYMDFVLCSYLFFAHPELNIPIPQIAAASEFSKIPFLGWFFQQTYAFYIQRGQGKEDPELKAKIEKLVEQNKTLEFFIEGARSRSRQFLKPKRGLLRALQNTGIPCTILPISISYDLVPEEKAFLSELRAAPKQKMKLSSLLRWTGRMIQGKVKLGRVHIVCGVPVRMDTTTDVHDVSRDVMYELQDKTVVSTFHLKAFLHYNPVKNVELEWLKQAIIERGGTVIDSNLADHSLVDPLNEKTMRYHWMHHFYSDLLKLQPVHPVLQHHVRENGFVHNISVESSDSEFTPDTRLISLLQEVFEPLTKEYMRVLDWASQNNGILPEAKLLVAKHPESFLPFVEEALSALSGCGLLKENSDGNGYIPGPRWSEIKSFYSSCHWGEEKALEVKLV